MICRQPYSQFYTTKKRRSGVNFTNAVRAAQIRIKEMTGKELVSYSEDFKEMLEYFYKTANEIF